MSASEPQRRPPAQRGGKCNIVIADKKTQSNCCAALPLFIYFYPLKKLWISGVVVKCTISSEILRDTEVMGSSLLCVIYFSNFQMKGWLTRGQFTGVDLCSGSGATGEQHVVEGARVWERRQAFGPSGKSTWTISLSTQKQRRSMMLS